LTRYNLSRLETTEEWVFFVNYNGWKEYQHAFELFLIQLMIFLYLDKDKDIS